MLDSRDEFIDAHNRYRKGDSIDDTELDTLIDFYQGLVNPSGVLGPEFGLFFVELDRRLRQLKGFRDARKERGNMFEQNYLFRVEQDFADSDRDLDGHDNDDA